MKNNKYLSRAVLLAFLTTSFFVMSGCKETIDLSDLAPGDSWCGAQVNLHDKDRYTATFFSSVLYPSGVREGFARKKVPCHWLEASSAPVPTQPYYVEKNRFDVSGTAYSDVAVGASFDGLWLLIESHSATTDLAEPADYSIAKRYTCELSLNANNELFSTAACPLLDEAKATIMFEPSTHALMASWADTENAGEPNERMVNYQIQADFQQDGIFTGKLENHIVLQGAVYHPMRFQLVRISDMGKTLGDVKLRDRTQALADPTTPFTTIYPITGFYEYQQGNAWQLRFDNNEQTILEASGQNAFAAVRGSMIKQYQSFAGYYWDIYNNQYASLYDDEGGWSYSEVPLVTVLEIADGKENNEHKYYGLFVRQYDQLTFNPEYSNSSEINHLWSKGADLWGKDFYVGVGGDAPIQQKFASFPYGERAPWQWLRNDKAGMNIEFYYHDEVIDDIFYVPINTNINYVPYTNVVPDKRASIRDIGSDIRLSLDENGEPVPQKNSFITGGYKGELIADADAIREASLEKLQQVAIDISW